MTAACCTRDEVLDIFDAVTPTALLRPVATGVLAVLGVTERPADPFALLTGRPRLEVTRTFVAALAAARGEQVCQRCGGTGTYGHHGVCFDCAGRRTVA